MTNASGKNTRELVAARQHLALLIQKTQRARGNLVALEKKALGPAHNVAIRHQPRKLLEANEQLVLAFLQAQINLEQTSAALDEASHTSQLDVLTGLPNRRLLCGRLAEAIARTKRSHTVLAVLFLDINGFKHINDTLGHTIGDAVLKETAHRLRDVVRAKDTVGRYGGDEFVLFIEGLTAPGVILSICEKIMEALAVPQRIGQHELHLSASIGVSFYPMDGDDLHSLIDCADAAMYHAKQRGLGMAFHSNNATPIPSLRPAVLLSPRTRAGDNDDADLHENEQRHAQLREANQQLVLATLNAQQLQSAADQAYKRQKDLLAMVVHELRNPLTPLKMVASMLLMYSPERLVSIQKVIERQTDHLSRLIDDLIDVTRAETGKFRIIFQPVDMKRVVDDAINTCRPAMDSRLQHFEAHVPSGALIVSGDELRLTQVLCNLLSNASKYTPDGGAIRLEVQISDGVLSLTLSDNGIGITAQALPLVFEPFVQDNHAIGFNGTGLGIGLTVVRELVECHHGTVTVHSAGLGRGCEFVVMLPLDTAATPPLSPPLAG